MRTTIRLTADCEVTLTAIDPYTEELRTRVFWVPTRGGYVREGTEHSAEDAQVCAGLSRHGITLTADNSEDLLRTIRVEWALYRREALKEFRA